MRRYGGEVKEIYGDIDGGFHDVASLRAEMPDVAMQLEAEGKDALDRFVSENMREVQRNAEANLNSYNQAMGEAKRERERADAERRRAEAAERNRVVNPSSSVFVVDPLRSELELERTRRRLAENYLDPFYTPTKYWEKERLKKEVKDELKNERPRTKVITRKVYVRAKSKPKKRAKSKPKKRK